MTFPEPPPLAEPTTCFLHHDRAAGRRCTRCGRYACPECLHQASVGSHCWECIKAAQPPLAQQVKRKLAQPLLVTRIIIGMNLVVFALQIVNGASLGSMFGGGSTQTTAFDVNWTLFVSGVGAGQWWRLVTSGFMHFGAIHIGFNMLILYRLGQDLESGIGRLRFTTIYVASLLGGSLAVVLLDANGFTGGASGAVFGMAGAATIALWQRGVRFYNTGWGPMLAFNLLLTFAIPGISVGGHIGGLTTGVVLGWLLLRPNASKSQTRVGYIVAVAIIVATFAISGPYAHKRHPSCVSSGTELSCLPNDF